MNPTARSKRAPTERGRQRLSNLSVQHSAEIILHPSSVSEAGFSMVTIPYFFDSDQPGDVKLASAEAPFAVDAMLANFPQTKTGKPKTTVSDISEPPAQWIEEPETDRDPDRQVSQPDSGIGSAATGLVDAILDRFPLAAPAILLFAGSEHNPHTDTICALVAKTLAERKIGKVLLVDSNRDGELTCNRGLEAQAGLSEIVNEGAGWLELITDLQSAALDFLPVGTAAWEQWGGAERLRSAAAELKRQYQFICVSAGDAHQHGARLWSGVCDGSYLFVSLKNSNETIAESAVTELQVSGARLLGCVVTDA